MNKHHAKLVAVVVAAVTLSGCGLFGIGRKDTGYETSRESRPLEVPPDLDAPSTSGALVIPETNAGGAADPAVAEQTPPSAMGGGADAPIGDESQLALTDDVSGAYRRVGLALERGEVGEIVSRDDTAGTYTVKTQITEREQGFFGRIFGRDKVTVGEATRVVRVVASGSGSTVQVEDEAGTVVDDAAARKIITALKRRLG